MKVVFNASVIFSGLMSPNGASAALLKHVRESKINGVISQFIFDEVVKHAKKLKLSSKQVGDEIVSIFGDKILLPPSEVMVNKFRPLISDPGDAHILAFYAQEKADVLVTLDKKHLLILQGKLKGVTILSPGEFLTKLRS